MTVGAPLNRLPARELARLVREKRASPVEVLEVQTSLGALPNEFLMPENRGTCFKSTLFGPTAGCRAGVRVVFARTRTERTELKRSCSPQSMQRGDHHER